MRKSQAFVILIGFLSAALLGTRTLSSISQTGLDFSMPLSGTIVATGIPGAGAIAQVGTFHKGGPFAPGGALAAASHPVLDRTRLLVASTSNFGAPLAKGRPNDAPGSRSEERRVGKECRSGWARCDSEETAT